MIVAFADNASCDFCCQIPKPLTTHELFCLGLAFFKPMPWTPGRRWNSIALATFS